jgi:hypothetical protein
MTSVRHPGLLLLLCTGAFAGPIRAFAAAPAYILVGDQTPPDGYEYASPQPAIATASSTCPDWSCGSDRSADNAIDGVQDFGWNSGNSSPGWIAVIFDAGRAASGVHIDGEVQPYPGLTVAEAPTVTQTYDLDVVSTDGVHHAFGATWTMLRHETTPGYLTVNGRDFEFGESLEVAYIRITITNVDFFPHDSWIAVDNITLITPIASDVDSDGDGIGDADDACPAEDASGWDLDADGCLDDSDGDGATDDVDVCPDGNDFLDEDGDETADDCDACPGDPLNDQDGDGLCTADDDCPLDPISDGIAGNYAHDDDHDGDGACNSDDLCPGGDDSANADGDAFADACDLCPLDPDNDLDGDGLCGDEDECDYSDTADSDGDGAPDLCDTLCPDDATNDADNDGICGAEDPCPLDYLDDEDGDGVCGGQDGLDACPGADDLADPDGDGVLGCHDACPDDFANDGDGDGLCESDDNCEGVSNPDQADADHDGIGNACEPDSDGDGVIDDVDNCDFAVNPGQQDADHDGQGDTCDTDDDNDGVTDGGDRCASTASGAPVLTNGCSLDQTCSPTATWKNHGAYVSCVSDTTTTLRRAGAISEATRSALVSAAGQSNVGKQ